MWYGAEIIACVGFASGVSLFFFVRDLGPGLGLQFAGVQMCELKGLDWIGLD